MEKCKKEKNLTNCNCSYSCTKKGICCDCVASHRRAGQLPACYFPDYIEKSYDRSVENFIKTVQKKRYKLLKMKSFTIRDFEEDYQFVVDI